MDLRAIVTLKPIPFNPEGRSKFLGKIHREASAIGLRSIADRYGAALEDETSRFPFEWRRSWENA